MPRSRADTVCCGCAAVVNDRETGDKVTAQRLQEAAETGAEILIDVCHNFHWFLRPAQKASGLAPGLHIVNYATYLTDAMGIPRRDSLE